MQSYVAAASDIGHLARQFCSHMADSAKTARNSRVLTSKSTELGVAGYAEGNPGSYGFFLAVTFTIGSVTASNILNSQQQLFDQ